MREKQVLLDCHSKLFGPFKKMHLTINWILKPKWSVSFGEIWIWRMGLGVTSTNASSCYQGCIASTTTVNYLRLAQSLNNRTVERTDQYPEHAAQRGTTHSNGQVGDKFCRACKQAIRALSWGLSFWKSPHRLNLTWARHSRGCAGGWAPRSPDTRTTRLGWWLEGRGSRSDSCAGRSRATGGLPEGSWRRCRWRWWREVAGICSALSCASAASSGACRICHSHGPCSSKACRWCGRESASSGRCCWRIFCHIRQTRTWKVSPLERTGGCSQCHVM